jgi:hypothetical protein
VRTHYVNSLSTGNAIAVDAKGNAYLAGSTNDLNFPAVNALQAQAPVKFLLVTNDGGSTWHALNNGLQALSVTSLAINPNGEHDVRGYVLESFRNRRRRCELDAIAVKRARLECCRPASRCAAVHRDLAPGFARLYQ